MNVAGFEIPLEVVVLGLISGLTYGLLGLGLTLVYKSSRVLNFAHGEMGALAALLIPILVINHRWNYWLALLAAIATAVVVGAVFERLVISQLRNSSRLTAMVATIAAAQVLFIINILVPRGGRLVGESYPTPFRARVTIGEFALGSGELIILVVAPTIVVGLTMFLRRSRLGRGSRAMAENAEVARLSGVPVNMVSLAIWVLAGLLAGLSSILVGPTEPLNVAEALGPGLMLRALAAGMLGGLVSLPGAFAGGLAIGVLEALVIWNYPVGGVLELVLFGVIVASLLVQRRLVKAVRGDASSWGLVEAVRALPHHIEHDQRLRLARIGGLVALLALAVVLPIPLNTTQQFFVASVPIFAMMGLSLVVLTGYAGQISLGQFAFVGIGAAVGGRVIEAGYSHELALLGAVMSGAVTALLVGIPALRMRGLFLAVTTLGFSVATSAWLFNQGWLVKRVGGTSLRISRPELLGVDLENEVAYYWVALAFLVVVAYVVHRLRNSAVGRSIIAVRDNEPSAESLSLSATKSKLLAFVISGMIASLAGFLYGGLLVSFSTDPGSIFGPARSLELVVMTVLGGMTTITGAVLGAVWVRGAPELLGENLGILTSGLGVLVVLLALPGGLASIAFRIRDELAGLLAGLGRDTIRAPAESAPMTLPPLGARVGDVVARGKSVVRGHPQPIRAEAVSVSFGGVRALDDVTVEAHPGEILGLMGPNGAGKTTLFDVLSGQIRPDSGQVFLGGREVTGRPCHRLARMGLARTYQQARLFETLTMVEAVSLAFERERRSGVLTNLAGLPLARREDRRRQERAGDIVEALGLGDHSHQPIRELSTGIRRMAELACAAALGADVLLLDEPTAGFSHDESTAFIPVLRSIRDRLDATIIVVDHDVPMMMELIDRLYVLEAGQVIAEGPASVLQENEAVATAYLGAATFPARTA